MDFTNLSGPERAILASQALNSSLNGRDGFLEAIGLADKITTGRREEEARAHTTGFLQAVFGGESPAKALRQFPKTDQGMAAGFLQDLERRRAGEAAATTAFGQDLTRDELAAARASEAATAAAGRAQAAKAAERTQQLGDQAKLGEAFAAVRGGQPNGVVPAAPRVGPVITPRATAPTLGAGYLSQLGVRPGLTPPGTPVQTRPVTDPAMLPADQQPFFMSAWDAVQKERAGDALVGQRTANAEKAEASATASLALIDSKIKEAEAKISAGEDRAKYQRELMQLQEQKLELAKQLADPAVVEAQARARARGGREGAPPVAPPEQFDDFEAGVASRAFRGAKRVDASVVKQLKADPASLAAALQDIRGATPANAQRMLQILQASGITKEMMRAASGAR